MVHEQPVVSGHQFTTQSFGPVRPLLCTHELSYSFRAIRTVDLIESRVRRERIRSLASCAMGHWRHVLVRPFARLLLLQLLVLCLSETAPNEAVTSVCFYSTGHSILLYFNNAYTNHLLTVNHLRVQSPFHILKLKVN